MLAPRRSLLQATSAVTAVYNQGRNELAAANFIVPQFAAVLAPALAALSAQSAASYLQANSGNATAIAMLVQAPSTLVGYSYSLDNIHPYDVPVATAITLVVRPSSASLKLRRRPHADRSLLLDRRA